ncbi:MAG: hypothetical protein GXO49_07605 [Chlorobi bacterium]|nr:hypothetical protein [Chlorobiota bacterium]
MNINGAGSMEQMRMMHRYGAGNGNGNMEMRNIMQQLPEDSRNSIRDQLKSLSPDQRKAAVSQITQLDFSNMGTEDLQSSISNIINSVQTETSNSYFSDNLFNIVV